jgi:hypothetical protein
MWSAGLAAKTDACVVLSAELPQRLLFITKFATSKSEGGRTWQWDCVTTYTYTYRSQSSGTTNRSAFNRKLQFGSGSKLNSCLNMNASSVGKIYRPKQTYVFSPYIKHFTHILQNDRYCHCLIHFSRLFYLDPHCIASIGIKNNPDLEVDSNVKELLVSHYNNLIEMIDL